MVSCAVFGCSKNHTHSRNGEIKLFRFPKSDKIRQKWLHLCKRSPSEKFNHNNAFADVYNIRSKTGVGSLISMIVGTI